MSLLDGKVTCYRCGRQVGRHAFSKPASPKPASHDCPHGIRCKWRWEPELRYGCEQCHNDKRDRRGTFAPFVDVVCKCGWTGKRQKVVCAKHAGRVEPFCRGCNAPYGMCPREGLPVDPVTASRRDPEPPTTGSDPK